MIFDNSDSLWTTHCGCCVTGKLCVRWQRWRATEAERNCPAHGQSVRLGWLITVAQGCSRRLQISSPFLMVAIRGDSCCDHRLGSVVDSGGTRDALQRSWSQFCWVVPISIARSGRFWDTHHPQDSERIDYAHAEDEMDHQSHWQPWVTRAAEHAVTIFTVSSSPQIFNVCTVRCVNEPWFNQPLAILIIISPTINSH